MAGSSRMTIFQAIADPTRRALLYALREGEQPVSVLMEPFDVTQSAISQHLAVLKDVGLVTQRRVGRQRYYKLCTVPLEALASWLALFVGPITAYPPQHPNRVSSDAHATRLKTRPASRPQQP